MPRTKQRTPELKDRLVSAAVGLLAEEGAAGLTARSLAARAETSAPALYELFGDKSGVVRELYFEGFRRLSAELAAVAETDGPDGGPVGARHEYRRFIRANRAVGGRHVLPAVHRLLARARRAGRHELGAGPRSSGGSAGASTPGRLRGDETDVAHVFVATDPGHGVRRGGGAARDVHGVGGAALAPGDRHGCSTDSAPTAAATRYRLMTEAPRVEDRLVEDRRGGARRGRSPWRQGRPARAGDRGARR